MRFPGATAFAGSISMIIAQVVNDSIEKKNAPICRTKTFFQVVCAMVLRDLETLLDRYMRKMRKSLARMYWDEDYENYEEEDVLP